MKKIGLMTLSCVPNQGAMLQAYATWRYFNDRLKDKKDISFEVINYEPLDQKLRYSKKGLIQATIKNHSIKDLVKLPFRLMVFNKKETYIMHLKGLNFQKLFLNTKKVDLSSLSNEYDAFVTGSDQTWNPYMIGDNYSFLLDFTDSQNKYAYAASFGISDFPDMKIDTYRNLLSKYKLISVREISGVDILKKILPQNNNYCNVLDPTLLLSKETWSQLEEKHAHINEKYAFMYLAKPSNELIQYATVYCKKNGIKLYVTSTPNTYTKFCNDNDGVNYLGMLSPQEFIAWIHYASITFTNSFHGIAFSLNFEKNFYTVLNDKKYSISNARLESILTVLGLQNRLISSPQIDSEEIEYSRVNVVLNDLRKKSKEFIELIIKDIEES